MFPFPLWYAMPLVVLPQIVVGMHYGPDHKSGGLEYHNVAGCGAAQSKFQKDICKQRNDYKNHQREGFF